MWHRLPAPKDDAPASRGRHSAALSPNGEMIIFGGQNYDRRTKYNDVCALNFRDLAWAKRQQPGRKWDDDLPPQARSSHSAVTTGNHMYIVGGALKFDADNGSKCDRSVWQYNFVKDRWKEMEVVVADTYGTTSSAEAVDKALPPRFGHVTVHRSAAPARRSRLGTVKAEIYLQGGRLRDGCADGLLRLSVSSGSKVLVEAVETVGEPLLPVFGHTSVYVSAHDKMYLFGGGTVESVERNCEPFRDDFLSVDLESMEVAPVAAVNQGPTPRYVHCAAMDVFQQVMFVFGGYNGGYLNDVWEFHFASGVWQQLSPLTLSPPSAFPAPSPRSGSTVLHHPRLNQLIVFGGCDHKEYFDEVWAYDVANTKRHYSLKQQVMMFILMHGIRVPVDALPRGSALLEDLDSLCNMQNVSPQVASRN
jgi:hypothetical protein